LKKFLALSEKLNFITLKFCQTIIKPLTFTFKQPNPRFKLSAYSFPPSPDTLHSPVKPLELITYRVYTTFHSNTSEGGVKYWNIDISLLRISIHSKHYYTVFSLEKMIQLIRFKFLSLTRSTLYHSKHSHTIHLLIWTFLCNKKNRNMYNTSLTPKNI